MIWHVKKMRVLHNHYAIPTDNKYVDAVWELTLAAWPYT